MIWIAVDAMGGDDAPRHVVDGALAAARDVDLGVVLVGPVARLEAELRRHPDVDRRRVRLVDAPDVVAMDESPAAALRRKPRRVDPGRRRDGGARRGGGAVQRRPHRRDRDGGARRVRHAARRRSSGAGGDDSDPRPARGPARRRRQRRVPAAAPPAVRGDGQRLRAGRARHRDAARRAAVDRRGGDQGQRADARGAPAAEGVAAVVHRQRRGARRLPRPGGRDRLRRVHRQRRAEDQRGARRSDRGAVERGVERDHRLLRVRRRAAARRRRRRHRRPRPVERQGRAQRRASWRTASRRDRFIERVEGDIAACAVPHQ